MKKITKQLIHTISSIDYDVSKIYPIQRKIQNAIGSTIKKNYIDTAILVIDHAVPIRIFFPKNHGKEAIIFYHGGGWVVGSVQNYTRTCINLCNTLNRIVISVDYRLAPEFPYPAALIDCYMVTKYFFTKHNFLDLKRKNITIMGDSAGATLAATISLLARDQKAFKVTNQILIYPLTYHDHKPTSPFFSVDQNGKDWILTTKRINDYMDLYVQDKKKLTSPYVTPLNATNVKHQPRTLIITAEYDPLRDEGEAYGIKLSKYNEVVIHRINDTIHGFFNNPLAITTNHICYELIKDFLKGEMV